MALGGVGVGVGDSGDASIALYLTPTPASHTQLWEPRSDYITGNAMTATCHVRRTCDDNKPAHLRGSAGAIRHLWLKCVDAYRMEVNFTKTHKAALVFAKYSLARLVMQKLHNKFKSSCSAHAEYTCVRQSINNSKSSSFSMGVFMTHGHYYRTSSTSERTHPGQAGEILPFPFGPDLLWPRHSASEGRPEGIGKDST